MREWKKNTGMKFFSPVQLNHVINFSCAIAPLFRADGVNKVKP